MIYRKLKLFLILLSKVRKSMEKTLENLISNNNRGLFLLDPPTGFGKTTAVIDLIKRFLKGDPCFSGVKRIFFVTNLLINLPYNDLLKLLTEE